MTGAALMGDREKCLAAGMDDYISKPVRLGELQATLERWGPTKMRKFDTATFFRRQAALAPVQLLNHSILDELRDMPPSDGVSMLQELIDLFLESAPERIGDLQHSLDDAVKLKRHAHALKSMSMNLGARKVVETCQKLEDLARAGATNDAPALLRDLQAVFVQTKDELLRLRGA